MKTRFRFEYRPGSPRPEGHSDGQGGDSRAERWGFVREFQELLGENVEPDPQFFVDCWTIGLPAATKNMEMRQSMLSGHEDESFEISDSGLMDSVYPEKNGSLGEFFSSVFPSLLSGQFNFGSSPKAVKDDSGTGEGDAFAEEFPAGGNTAQPMTLQRAHEVLGVSPTSTPNQVKAAYRQRVREWHPDRIDDSYKAARQFATEKLAEINEAYRLLRIPVI